MWLANLYMIIALVSGIRVCLCHSQYEGVFSVHDKSVSVVLKKALLTTQVLNQVRCAQTCVQTPKCNSYFYSNETRTCVLHGHIFEDPKTGGPWKYSIRRKPYDTSSGIYLNVPQCMHTSRISIWCWVDRDTAHFPSLTPYSLFWGDRVYSCTLSTCTLSSKVAETFTHPPHAPPHHIGVLRRLQQSVRNLYIDMTSALPSACAPYNGNRVKYETPKRSFILSRTWQRINTNFDFSQSEQSRGVS